jgi:hypothetical protein
MDAGGRGDDDGGAAPVRTVPAGHDPTLLGVAFAGIVSVVVSEDEWDLFDSMIGLTLVFLLLAYGRFRREVVGSRWEAVAAGAVWGFCVVLVFGFLIEDIQGWLRWPPVAGQRQDLTGFWFAAVWLVATVVFAIALRLGGERLLHPSRRRRS